MFSTTNQISRAPRFGDGDRVYSIIMKPRDASSRAIISISRLPYTVCVPIYNIVNCMNKLMTTLMHPTAPHPPSPLRHILFIYYTLCLAKKKQAATPSERIYEAKRTRTANQNDRTFRHFRFALSSYVLLLLPADDDCKYTHASRILYLNVHIYLYTRLARISGYIHIYYTYIGTLYMHVFFLYN